MERIRRFIRELSEQQWLEQQQLRSWDITRAYYSMPGEYEDYGHYPEGHDFERFPSTQGNTYFFRTELEVPNSWQHAPYGLIFNSGGEGLLRVNGHSYQGLDRNHTYVTLDPASVGVRPQLEIELFDPVPEPVDPLNQQAVIQPPITSILSLLVRPNEAVRSLMHTVTMVRDAAALLPESDLRQVRLVEAIHQAMDQYAGMSLEEIRQEADIRRLEERLKRRTREIGGNAEGLEHMVGQSHIDIAWLWPVRETVRKTSRTFSTVDALMNEYPHYVYSQSQPLLYAFLKENDPELYARVKKRIAEGRWELVGGMWVEPDLNIPSGESLIRQMLYGQRFYREEFGIVSRIEWLPDTFGYCASLPQILKHGNVDYFMTTKLGWNDTNVFPYDLFHWVGIDGTSMLSYLNHGVNEHTLPKDINDHWQSYRQKATHPEQMLLYGHGDGGGGVTREMLEYIDRSELMVGQPESRYSTAGAFFARIEAAQPQLPKWHGDLYLELHRGTYTTHARNKRSNRKAEVLYREAELWSTLAHPGMKAETQSELHHALHAGWKLILLNQFHDIIPGSAITESYITSSKEYEDVFQQGRFVLEQSAARLAEQVQIQGAEDSSMYMVLNSLGWKRSAVIHIPARGESACYAVDETGQHLLVDPEGDGWSILVKDIPAFGYRTIWLMPEPHPAAAIASLESAPIFNDTWDTAYYHVQFNERGEMTRIWDKTSERDVLKPDEPGNQFHFFHDRPTLWDAWDIDDRYEQQTAGEVQLLEKSLVLAGRTKDVLRFRWQLHQSELTQDIIFYHDSRRIDFKTHVDWHEHHKLLKVGFPIDVVTTKATYEIPFGALERVTHRNTSWEQAQYEVCGHRFADVSEHGYGVSLLNDCKYGYDVQGSTIRLSLLRASKWPDRTADQGEHEFTYSLYPHNGDWREAHTVRHAAELNHEGLVQEIIQQKHDIPRWRSNEGENECALTRSLPATGAWITFDSEHVILDTVKRAEDGQGTVLRFYESSGKRERITLKWPHAFEQAYHSNALEDEGELLGSNGGEFTLFFRPYQIQTVLLR
ncbi:alpha-mannosidase [Paenibacillus barcinonensis]|uniref:alpha-mannosidase n=1 Tax=Paenibacillus barcinonensis TaxID=198119 RepID=A0A2V4WL21_PAEBA|nr:alpha-mannosidase [Paenibacillus barcinonensis]PYE48226.1 alpha-mannosidase [Paenibacillus barcinonensis]QKS56922.1 alpha-mannosidase [Paenibacillus barcinonensis]